MTSTADAIVLIGPMGAGKSSVGRRVARSLGVPFQDSDRLIVQEHGPIPEIFVARGETGFRALERDAVTAALQRGGVVALGGGAIVDPDTRAALHGYRVVLLTVDRRTVSRRLRHGTRPLLRGEDPIAEWTRIRDERLPLYEEVADATFDTSSGPLGDVVARIVTWVREKGQQ